MKDVETGYSITVLVKTKSLTGHVSVALTNPVLHTSHMSLNPTSLGYKITALTFGSIPVLGVLTKSFHEDLKEATHIFTKSITEKEYKQAVTEQARITEGVHNKTMMFSALGSVNLVCRGLTSFFNTAPFIKKTEEAYHRRTGFYLPMTEDPMGNTMESMEDIPDMPATATINCVSVTTAVLNAAGIPIRNPLMPSFFRNPLIKHGFSHIEQPSKGLSL